jgi:hypothetical protein
MNALRIAAEVLVCWAALSVVVGVPVGLFFYHQAGKIPPDPQG